LVIANTDVKRNNEPSGIRSRVNTYKNGKPYKPFPLTSEVTLEHFRKVNKIDISIKFLDD